MYRLFADLFAQMILPAFEISVVIFPFVLPIVGVILLWTFFKEYMEEQFAAKNKKILLEIKMPREIKRSPLAMELVLTGLYITSRETTWIDRNIKGQSRPTFSLEIASFAGDIHFYIRTEEGLKNLVEAQIYAQYPNVELHDAPDYTYGVEYIPGIVDMHAVEFIKEKGVSLPIKTYVDYGLDKDDEEYFKTDPMTPMLELMGSLKPNEQIWFQIIMKAHKKEHVAYVKVKNKTKKTKVDWTYEGNEQKLKLLQEFSKPLADGKDGQPGAPRRPTMGESDQIKALERNISKIPFDVGIRAIYIAPKTDFRGVIKGGLGGVVRQYNAPQLNSFKGKHIPGFDYPWQDYKNIRVNKDKKKMLKYFKERDYWGIRKLSFFKGLEKRDQVVLSTEELATMYHLPGEVATTPSFGRIMSRKAEAPSNLPV